MGVGRGVPPPRRPRLDHRRLHPSVVPPPPLRDAPPAKLKGITFRPNGRVSARVSGGGEKQVSVGTFDTLEEALDAYNAEARRRGVPTQTLPAEDAPEEQSSNLSRDARPTASAASDASARTSERIVREVLDSSFPGRWYPAARSMRRSIHLHVGPTNSGKTHAAIQRLRQAESGVYCSPLRLLAWEIAENLNRAPRSSSDPPSVACDLVTGQEKRRREGARHVACTVEMADVTRPVAVAVIDEAHLLGDARRGYAFTRAFVGLPAAEVHLCGDPAMEPLVRAVCAELGDDLEVYSYERLQKLHLLEEPLRRIEDVEPGDCLVAFSRKRVHKLKREVERRAGRKACVIYGSLPPEARARQAALFNDRDRSGHDVLIASDAIGMGLNLSVRRVIFTEMTKFDGVAARPLEPPEARQIAGRAGRFGMGADVGGATTTSRETLPALKTAVEAPVVYLNEAAVAPTLEQIQMYCEARPDETLADALRAFAGAGKSPVGKMSPAKALASQGDPAQGLEDEGSPAQGTEADPAQGPGGGPFRYFAHESEDMIHAAELVAHLPLSVEDRWMFATAPCSAEDPSSRGATALVVFAETFCRPPGRVSVRIIGAPEPFRAPTTQGQLSVLEQAHAAYDLYLWFSLRCPSAFPEHDLAQALRKTCAVAIELGLARSSAKNAREGRRNAAGGGGGGAAGSRTNESFDEGVETLVADDDGAARLAEAVAAVRAEEAKLEAEGFGADADEGGVYGAVTFAAAGGGGGGGGGGGFERDRRERERGRERGGEREGAAREGGGGVGGEFVSGNRRRRDSSGTRGAGGVGGAASRDRRRGGTREVRRRAGGGGGRGRARRDGGVGEAGGGGGGARDRRGGVARAGGGAGEGEARGAAQRHHPGRGVGKKGGWYDVRGSARGLHAREFYCCEKNASGTSGMRFQ